MLKNMILYKAKPIKHLNLLCTDNSLYMCTVKIIIQMYDKSHETDIEEPRVEVFIYVQKYKKIVSAWKPDMILYFFQEFTVFKV